MKIFTILLWFINGIISIHGACKIESLDILITINRQPQRVCSFRREYFYEGRAIRECNIDCKCMIGSVKCCTMDRELCHAVDECEQINFEFSTSHYTKSSVVCQKKEIVTLPPIIREPEFPHNSEKAMERTLATVEEVRRRNELKKQKYLRNRYRNARRNLKQRAEADKIPLQAEVKEVEEKVENEEKKKETIKGSRAALIKRIMRLNKKRRQRRRQLASRNSAEEEVKKSASSPVKEISIMEKLRRNRQRHSRLSKAQQEKAASQIESSAPAVKTKKLSIMEMLRFNRRKHNKARASQTQEVEDDAVMPNEGEEVKNLL